MENDYNDIFDYRFAPYIPLSITPITNEIVSVQPMTEPSGTLFYMDYHYPNKKKEFKFFRGYGV